MRDNLARKGERRFVYFNPKFEDKRGSGKRPSRRAKNFDSMKPKSRAEEITRLWVLGVCLVFLLMIILPCVIISGKEKIYNNKIAELNAKISAEQIKNAEMEREYINKTSYTAVQHRAHELGMVEAQSKVVIVPEDMVVEAK